MLESRVEQIELAFHSIKRSYKPHDKRIRFSRQDLTLKEVTLKKKQERLLRQQTINKTLAAQQLISWICLIQKKLNLSHEGFVNRINKNGGKVTKLTVRLWRNNHGHFPSEKNFRALMKLDREAKITKEEFKIVIGITTTGILENK